MDGRIDEPAVRQDSSRALFPWYRQPGAVPGGPGSAPESPWASLRFETVNGTAAFRYPHSKNRQGRDRMAGMRCIEENGNPGQGGSTRSAVFETREEVEMFLVKMGRKYWAAGGSIAVLLFFGCFTGGFPRAALAGEVTLYPTADATVSYLDADMNFGSDDRVSFGNDFAVTEVFLRTLMRFDVSSISSVTSATLYIWKAECDGCPVPYELRGVQADWVENSVTWNNKPATGDFLVSDFAFALGDWNEIDVTDLVKDWVELGVPNYGLEIRGTNDLGTQVAYVASREWATGSQRPYLLIDTGTTPVVGATWGSIKRLYSS